MFCIECHLDLCIVMFLYLGSPIIDGKYIFG